MVSGHVCADVTLASRDGLEEDGSDIELWKGTAFCLIRRQIVRLN
jgi:hypothetical protein